MSIKHLKQNYRKSASLLHRKVGDILRSHPITKNLITFQEYPVPNSRYKIDWFIRDLNIAIEVAGQQHGRPVAFDGNKEQAEINFIKQVDRDIHKHQLIRDAGWKLIEIWFDEINEKTIIKKVMEAIVGK